LIMERKLLIIRHGKSSWDNEGLDDIDRPLAQRGIRDAEEMARRIMALGPVPDQVFASPANRALNTARIMSRVWNMDPGSLQIHESLYMGHTSEISQVVGQARDDVARLAIFGHNPSFTMYGNTFLDDPLDNLPTAGVVIVTLNSNSWQKLKRTQVIHSMVDFPKRRR